MLFTIRNEAFGEHTQKNIRIVKNDKYGIMNESNDTFILPEDYDNVFCYGKDTFVVYKDGKIGVVRIENYMTVFIAECEFDTLENIGHDLVLCNDEKVRYYNAISKTTKDFIDVVVDVPFLYCRDEKYQYILFGELGEEIYKKEYTPYSQSCFSYCGNTEKGPVFYDARYSTYLYPQESEYRVYKGMFNHPIIVNRENVCNITEGENGIGVIDSFGNNIIENKYDSVKMELKVTAMRGGSVESKTIPLFKNIFEKGGVSQIEEWI